MKKREFKYEHIGNSAEIRKSIINKVNHTMFRTWEFTSSINGNNRSSTKTDFLHYTTKDILLTSLGDNKKKFDELNFEFVVETDNALTKKTKSITVVRDIVGGVFNVDIIIKKNDNIHTVFLLKSSLTSINKNRFNSINSIIGEINRFYGNPENQNINLVFINLTPEETFVKNSNHKLKKEVVNYIGLNTLLDTDLSPKTYLEKSIIREDLKSKISEIHINYKLNFDIDLSLITDINILRQKIEEGYMSITTNDVELYDLEKYILTFIDKELS